MISFIGLESGMPVAALYRRKKVVGLSTESVSNISTAMMALRFFKDMVTRALSS